MDRDSANLLQAPAIRDWLRFVMRGSEEGRRWAQDYCRPEILGLEFSAYRALSSFRRHRFTEGLEALRQIEERLEGCTATPAVSCVLDRWYQGVLSYYWYCIEDFSRAIESLERANASLTSAIDLQRALVSLGNHCIEFELHFARIARNRRRWSEMRHHVEVARAMNEGRIPLCRLAEGTAVYISDVCAFFESISLDDEERASLSELLDEELRLRGFNRFVDRIYALPAFVIPYTDT